MKQLSKLTIGVLGAGVAGLASAIRLQVAGYRVVVFERNAYPGGKLSSFQQDGYRFDAGPSLFTMPQYVDEVLEIAGSKHRQDFTYTRLDTICNYFWPDGNTLSAPADENDWIKKLAAFGNLPESRVAALLQRNKTKYDLTGKIFTGRSLHQWQSWFRVDVLKALTQLHQYDLFTSMHRVHQRYLQHPQLVQLFDRFATYNGSNPYKAPGMLTLIPHLEHHYGAYLPHGGMESITDALYRAALDSGVTFHFSSRVTGLETHQRQITSVLTNATPAGGRAKSAINTKKHPVDGILSNMDVWYTYRHLLPHIQAPERVLNQARSTSALIFYWGVKGVFPMLSVHSIFFAANYRAEFEALSADSVLHDDPTVYINVTSKLLPGDAPDGCENWFVMINVPYGKNIDWHHEVPRLRKIILRKIEDMLGKPIESLIETEAVLTPEDIDHKTGSYLGSLYGTSSDSTMAAFMRHPNFSRQIKNLFFAGGSVHPGGGIPLCLQSAKIACNLINDYFTNKKSA